MSPSRNKGLLSTGLVLLTAASLLTGCRSISHSQYTAPRVTGRVLDFNTRQPLARVHVRRVPSESNPRPASTPPGGRLMQEDAASVRTDRDGQFVMKSSRVLGPLGATGWYGVTLAFEKVGYQSVVREFTLGSSTNTAAGEPVIPAGDILLPRMQE